MKVIVYLYKLMMDTKVSYSISKMRGSDNLKNLYSMWKVQNIKVDRNIYELLKTSKTVSFKICRRQLIRLKRAV